MELKKGYKRTEIGVLPEEWTIVTYGDAFDLLSTATYSRAFQVKGGAVKYIHYGDIHTKFDHFLFAESGELPTIPQDLRKSYTYVQHGDIVMADASEDYEGVGKSVEVVNPNANPIIAGLHTYLLRDTDENFADGFRAYISEGSLVKGAFQRLQTGMKVFGVSKANLVTIPIPVPPKPEQRAIAQTLQDVDQLLQALEQRLAKKEAIKRGAMQRLLTPGEGWEESQLQYLVDIVMGQSPNSIYYNTEEAGLPLIQGNADIKNRESIRRTWTSIASKKCRKGDLLLTVRAPVGHIAIASFDSCLGRGVCSIQPHSVDKKYLYYCLIHLEENWLKLEQGSTFTSANSEQIGQLEVAYPDRQIQTQIATILTDFDTELDRLRDRLHKYRQLKRGLMQQLLTGKIRLV